MEPERRGKYVNVSSAGFRFVKDQGEWPPSRNNYNVFLFGGSTTFGYGVGDDQTFASYLQEYLYSPTSTRPIKIYNFGQGGHYSLQERVLFEDLLRRGMIPDLAVFTDGLNDLSACYDSSHVSVETKTIQDSLAITANKQIFQIAGRLPVIELSKKFSEKMATLARKGDGAAATSSIDTEMIIGNYLTNKKMIEAQAEVFGVKTLFVWQPIPYYNYDLSDNIFLSPGAGVPDFAKGYSKIKEEKDKLRDFLWLADLGRATPGQLFVDSVHYAPRFNRVVAKNIADYLNGKHYFEIKKK
jgi:hypothetical protein